MSFAVKELAEGCFSEGLLCAPLDSALFQRIGQHDDNVG